MAGNHIYLRVDETGTFLILAHLKKGSINVREGQHVNEGEFLAQVGNSGSSSGSIYIFIIKGKIRPR